MCLRKSGGVLLDLAHSVAVVDLLTAVGTLVELQGRDRVRLAVKFARPISSHLLDLRAAAGGTSGDLQHTVHIAFFDEMLRIDSATSSSVRLFASISTCAF